MVYLIETEKSNFPGFLATSQTTKELHMRSFSYLIKKVIDSIDLKIVTVNKLGLLSCIILKNMGA